MSECLGKIAPGPLLRFCLLEGELEVFLPAKDGRVRSPEGDKDPAIRQMELFSRELGPFQRRLCIHIAADTHVAKALRCSSLLEESSSFAAEAFGGNEARCFLCAFGKAQACRCLRFIQSHKVIVGKLAEDDCIDFRERGDGEGNIPAPPEIALDVRPIVQSMLLVSDESIVGASAG